MSPQTSGLDPSALEILPFLRKIHVALKEHNEELGTDLTDYANEIIDKMIKESDCSNNKIDFQLILNELKEKLLVEEAKIQAGLERHMRSPKGEYVIINFIQKLEVNVLG